MTSQPNRNRSVEHLLRRSLREREGSVLPGSCLDAETLAAWIDSGLTADELATAEAHVSDCARCQALLAAMVQAIPAASAQQRWWLRPWRLGWLVPLTAAAAAVLIWIAVPRDESPRSLEQTGARTRVATLPKPQEPEAPADRDRSSAPAAAGGERQARAAGVDQRRNDAKDEPANAQRAQVAEREAREENAPLGQERARADSVGRLAEAARAPAVAAPSVSAAAEAVTAEQPLQMSRLAGASEIEIVSPSPSSRWLIGAGGAVQHTADGGSTWEALSTGVTAELTAGASPSPSVCWLVGRMGTVLLSTDGRRWQRIAFPESADLTAVRAIDARRATVTTVDGRTFSTTDGGLVWLQDF